MTSTNRYKARYQHISEQHAYQRRIAAFGLPALLAPYSRKPIVRIPEQRQPQVSLETVGR